MTTRQNPQGDPLDYLVRDQTWCFTVRSVDFDIVCRQVLSDQVRSGDIIAYECVLGMGSIHTHSYPPYHGTVFLRTPQRDVGYFLKPPTSNARSANHKTNSDEDHITVKHSHLSFGK